jgi:hypothetical protein
VNTTIIKVSAGADHILLTIPLSIGTAPTTTTANKDIITIDIIMEDRPS